jgi:GNAT superfamily N-acetyltransferase
MGALGSDVLLSIHDVVPPEAARVDAGLDAFNFAAAPLNDVRPLVALLRTADQHWVGGVVGRTWGECAEVQQLWVETAYRRQGWGTYLMNAFEEQARARGCRTVYLETFSFQAPDFYRALGYEVRLELSGFAPGIRKYILVRELVDLS